VNLSDVCLRTVLTERENETSVGSDNTMAEKGHDCKHSPGFFEFFEFINKI
jgi:hypothetical protein